MTRDETKQILAAMAIAYPNFKADNMEATLSLWEMVMGEYDYKIMQRALIAFIKTNTSGFAPSMGNLINEYVSLVTAAPESPAELWGLVLNAVRRSTYYAREEFERLPPAAQRAVGSPDVLQAWATQEGLPLSVIESTFMRNLKETSERTKKELLISNERAAALAALGQEAIECKDM